MSERLAFEVFINWDSTGPAIGEYAPCPKLAVVASQHRHAADIARFSLKTGGHPVQWLTFTPRLVKPAQRIGRLPPADFSDSQALGLK